MKLKTAEIAEYAENFENNFLPVKICKNATSKCSGNEMGLRVLITKKNSYPS